jgi:lipopolysaccharide export system permease protein
MIRLIDRYVAREFMKLFVLSSLGIPLLFILGDWTEKIDSFSRRNIPVHEVALGYFYQMPLFLSYSFPIAALIATVFTVSSMTRHAEMTAAKAGGISFYRALMILPPLGVLLTIAGLALSELAPAAGMRSNELWGQSDKFEGITRSDFVYGTRNGESVIIRNLDANRARIDGIAVERRGDGVETPSVNIYADSALYQAGRWHLYDGYYRQFWQDTLETSFRFRTMVSHGFTEEPTQLTATPKKPEEMSYAELGRYIEVQQRSGQMPRKLMVEQMQKLALPVATLIIILFGAPLANTSSRGGPAYGIGISLGITIFYLMLFKLTQAMGITGALSPFAAAWLPNGLFLVAAAVTGVRIRT